MKVKTTAENRKDVVKAMEEILNVKAKYQGPPSFGYKVGEYTVDRDGNVEHESEEAALTMQNELVARGLAEGEADRLPLEKPSILKRFEMLTSVQGKMLQKRISSGNFD